MDVLKLPVDRGETDIGYPIETMEFLHHFLPDLRASDLPLAFFLEIGLDPVDALLNDIDADGPLFAGLFQAIEDFNPVEGFSPSVFFNDQGKRILRPLACGKTLLTFEAFPPPPDRLFVFAQTGVNNLAFGMIAEGAFHLIRM